MSQNLTPRTSVEQAVLALLMREVVFEGEALSSHPARVGGDFPGPELVDPWYIRIDRVPGGRFGRIQGYDVVDLEVFSTDYARAESLAFALEALALGYPHVVEVGDRKVVLDSVSQNVGVADLPWEDDSVYRLGATFAITARRR